MGMARRRRRRRRKEIIADVKLLANMSEMEFFMCERK
jgi:hypothetical protein